ncbi:MAG: hypothetical protein PHN80_03975 [Hespellia sp.]|nr:hypothetical protein [Hespellia sp.]
MGRLKQVATGSLMIALVVAGSILLTKDSVADHTTDNLAGQIVTAGELKNTSNVQDSPNVQIISFSNQNETEVTQANLLEANPLMKNQYPKVNEFVAQYYSALAKGDKQEIGNLVEQLDDSLSAHLENNQKFVEEYRNITVYSKKGQEAGSLVAYVYYEMKIRNIDTLVPGMDTLYLRQNEDCTYYIANGDEQSEAYVAKEAKEEDVCSLLEEVQKKYNAALKMDETLRAEIEDLQTAYTK